MDPKTTTLLRFITFSGLVHIISVVTSKVGTWKPGILTALIALKQAVA